MFIEHKEYLALLDQIDYLKKDNILLRQQNEILTEQILKQQKKRLQLEDNHAKDVKLIEQLHEKAIYQETSHKKQIMQKIAQMEKQTKQYFQSKLTNLEHSSLTQLQSLQMQNTQTKLNFYELLEFVNKLRQLYCITKGIENIKCKKQPTLMDLLKWIKSIPGVAVTLTKTGFSTSMSMSNLKKTAMGKSRFKENHSILNCPQSKSRVKA